MKISSKDSKIEDIELLMDSDGLDENFIKSVGRLTLNFAHLEFCFTLFTGSQLGTRQPLNQIIVSELSFKQLLNISSGSLAFSTFLVKKNLGSTNSFL